MIGVVIVSEEMTEQMQVRIDKMNELLENRHDPFGGKFTRKDFEKEIVAAYDHLSKEELAEENKEVTIEGRIMTRRRKGKAGFTHIQDMSGQIQVYVRKDAIGDDPYEIFKTLDLGDI